METEKAPERLTYQSLVIDITKKKVSIDDEEVQLTKKEFEILLLLVQNKGRVFSREDILARIWSDEVYVLDRTIDVNITVYGRKLANMASASLPAWDTDTALKPNNQEV